MTMSNLTSYIRTVAYQRRLMEPWRNDRCFTKGGGTILYALDADIVKLYTAPEEMSVPRGNRKEGYAQIFPDDDQGLSVALGYSLAGYIFHHLTDTKHPLLVIPPIEEEIRRVYAAVASDAETEQENAYDELATMRKMVQSLNQESDKGKLLASLVKEAPNIARLLTGRRGPSSELRRFGYLMAKTRIAPPEYVLEQGWFTNETVQHALSPVEGVANWMRIHDLREAWFDRLSKTKSHAKGMVRIYDDAQAMARLEWINTHLDDHHRLVYITGDNSLHEAARNYFPIKGKPSFADIYLRHPRAYLAEPRVLSPEKMQHKGNSDENTEFVSWLDTFLGELQLDTRKYAGELDSLLKKSDVQLGEYVKSVLKTHPDIINKFKSSWSNYTRNLVLANVPEMITDAEQNDFKKLVENVESLIKKVEKLLEERVRETWDSCFGIATETGFGLLVYKQTHAKIRPRNYPPLAFNSFPKTQDFVEQILSPNAPKPMKARTYKKAISDLLIEDSSGYAYNLAYACLFAAWGNWHISAILAGRAIDIAKRCEQNNITGREAAYLRAVSLRHTAKHVRDLDKVEPLIDKAEQCLREERNTRRNLKACEIRFEIERHALFLTLRLFQLFLNEDIPTKTPDLAQIQDGLQKLLLKLDEQSVQEKRWLIRNVERILLTNIFMTALLCPDKLQEPCYPTSLISYFDRLQKNIDSEETPAIETSFHVRAIYLAAGLWTTQNPNDKKRWQRELQDHLSDSRIKDNSVFPYDRKRFEFLRELSL